MGHTFYQKRQGGTRGGTKENGLGLVPARYIRMINATCYNCCKPGHNIWQKMSATVKQREIVNSDKCGEPIFQPEIIIWYTGLFQATLDIMEVV